MSESTPSRPPVDPPNVGHPPAFVERRTRHRREADRDGHRETVFLARSLDILAAGGDPESRLAAILDLVARTAGAQRAAIAAGVDRRVAVAARTGEDTAAALALGRWLDTTAERSRARRAASVLAPVLVVALPDGAGTEAPRPGAAGAEPPVPGPDSEPIRASLPIAGLSDVALGFEFADARSAERLSEQLPPALARHAAAALALATEQLTLERELASLRATAAERSAFVSTVAHELRTPLTGLSGYLDLILDGKVSDADVEREFLERGRGIVHSMGELVGDLLELSRLEAGSLRLELSPFSVAEAAARVAANLLPIALDRGIELVSTLPPRLRAATGDRRRVEQILTNLAANALKFTASGRRVEIAAWFDGPLALIAVRDEGPGIAADDRGRIFERFYRMPVHDRVTGTGLGLPIARELAQAMGGDLDVASVPGSGSSFVLALAGPAPTDAGAVDAALARAIHAEELALEERAVLRAMNLSGRSTRRPA